MPNASPPDKVLLLEQLTSVGGTTALKTVVAAAKSSDDAMRDAATRLLGEWLSADGYEAAGSIGGSFVSDDIEDYPGSELGV